MAATIGAIFCVLEPEIRSPVFVSVRELFYRLKHSVSCLILRIF
jgi:hypothetical protein